MADDLMTIEPGDVQPYEQQGTSIETSRATAESQAGFIMAKQFPRNEDLALNRILNSCRRVGLARNAEYAFPKGGTTVSGPSVRLAEAVAQQWGNILFGIREMEQKEGETVMMAYCYDLETNTRAERIFTVKHQIKLKGGGMKTLDDPRDVYEINFNMGARRKRACILEVIPGDVIELAVEACNATLAAEGEDASPEAIQRMVDAFGEKGVTQEMIELRQGKNVEALVASELAMLRKIYKSIEDGMATPEKWFGEEVIAEPKRVDKKKDKPKAKKTPKDKKTKAKAGDKKADKKEPEGAPEAPPGDPEPPNAFEEAAAAKKEPEKKKEKKAARRELPTLTSQIEVVKFIKDGGTPERPWTLYHISTADGTKLACFDQALIEKAEEICDSGELCEIEYNETEKGKSIVDITVIG